MDIHLHKYIERTTVEGPGNRFCIWVQGCSLHCEGCMVPTTWPFSKENGFDCLELAKKIVSTEEIEGLTILGGEPFDQPEALLCLLQNIKKLSSLSIMLFTGYTRQILEKQCPQFKDITSFTDIFIEGPYIKSKTDFSRPWVGSSNQKIHLLTHRYTSDCLSNTPIQKIEIRIPRNGDITINGMLPKEKLLEFYEDYLKTNNS